MPLRAAISLLCFALAGCVTSVELGSDCDRDGGCVPAERLDASGGMAPTFPVEPEPLSGIASLDVLFVIDDSEGAQPLQAAFAARLPALVHRLLAGQLDDGGWPEFHPLDELRASVIPSSRGVSSTTNEGCESRPNAALTTRNAAPECMGVHAPLMRVRPGDGGAGVAELACAVQLGGAGCGVSQPLQAMVEGLERLREAQLGEFAEDSAQLVVVLTNREDCSTEDALLFAPDDELAPDDPLRTVPDALRCTRSPRRLTDGAVFAGALQRLRLGMSERVLFMPVAGFPDELLTPAALEAVRFSDESQRVGFYQAVLDHSRMRYADVLGAAGHAGDACASAANPATPGRRLAGMAQLHGSGARLGSACESPDAAFDALGELLASRVGLAGL